jgi:hypothetical protein
VKFFETVRDALRTRHYAYRTEKTYLHWIRHYMRFVKPVHPHDAGADGVKRIKMKKLQVAENDVPKCYNQFVTVTFGGALCFYPNSRLSVCASRDCDKRVETCR